MTNVPDSSDQSRDDSEKRHEQAPSYDTSKQDYAGITSTGFDAIEDLRGAKDFAALIADTVREGLLVLDLDLRVKAASASFYRIFQIAPEEPLGQRVYELGGGQWDIPRLRQLLEDLLPESNVVGDYEVEHTFEAIGRRTLRLGARRLGKYQLILLAIEDVTEQQHRLAEAREWFDLLVENAKEYAIFAMDPDLQITAWNPGAERILGWREEEALGQPGAIIFTPEDRAAGRHTQEWDRAQATGAAEDDRWHMRKDGSRFWGSGFLIALREGEALRGFAKVIRDKTRQKLAEEALRREGALRRMNETLEERVAERTELVRELAATLTRAEQQERRRIAQILHDDLQQRLFGVDIKLSLIRLEAGDNPEMQKYLDMAEAWLWQCIELTRSLTVDLSPPILMGNPLADTIRWLQGQMQELHGLEVAFEVDEAFRMPREDVRVLLFQIVRELLFNVVKHAETNRAVVEARNVDHNVEVVVRDEGKGFDVEAAEARKEEGGFGLFSVRERLGLFGGQMRIVSAPGAGTRVTVQVPLQMA